MKVHRKTSARRKPGTKTAPPRKAGKAAPQKDASKKDVSKKDTLQFAPNFTAYVMPPDVVCLYSEDRKFFLHGELYCALASEIAKGGKSAKDLVGDLRKQFPSDKIEEALKRLIERRYVTAAAHGSNGTVAGYWASLGLPPDVADKNLGNCKVRVESFDVAGAKELTAALSELGVRVVQRSQDLTVTLVNDYLERRLAQLNQQRVSDKTPWLLVQPSGVFPLVGPVFKPGESACWTCLFDRMIRNREIKGFLDRGAAQPIAISPLVRNTLGQGAIQFAAIEIAKAIASGDQRLIQKAGLEAEIARLERQRDNHFDEQIAIRRKIDRLGREAEEA